VVIEETSSHLPTIEILASYFHSDDVFSRIFSIFPRIVILHDLRQKSLNISASAPWILDRVPVLETSLDSTWTLGMLNKDWMTNKNLV
jgi:hypothetical protein